MDDDIELPPDVEGAIAPVIGEDGFFVPPPRGQPPSQMWSAKSSLVYDHVVGGSFESAARLLHDQVSTQRDYSYKIINFSFLIGWCDKFRTL